MPLYIGDTLISPLVGGLTVKHGFITPEADGQTITIPDDVNEWIFLQSTQDAFSDYDMVRFTFSTTDKKDNNNNGMRISGGSLTNTNAMTSRVSGTLNKFKTAGTHAIFRTGVTYEYYCI